MDGEINQGDLYWCDLGPPLGSGPGYTRPVVVIQNNATNHSRIGSVIVCPLTSNLKRGLSPENVSLAEGEGGLSLASVVQVTQIIAVDKSKLRDYIGSLSPKLVRKTLRGLYFVTEPRDYEEKPNVD